MHDKRRGADDEGVPTPAERDERDQAAVLRLVLLLHPHPLTLDELVRETTAASLEFAERDRIERAVRSLVEGGLIRRHGDLVLPTRAAVLFYELEEV